MIKFSIKALEKSGITISGAEPAEFLELAANDIYRVAGEVIYELTGQYLNGNILVKGSAKVLMSGICGRCLKELEFELANRNIHLFYDDIDVDELDVGPELREELLVNLPINLLCADDCKGLCPYCRQDLNRGDCSCEAPELPPDESPWSELDNLKL